MLWISSLAIEWYLIFVNLMFSIRHIEQNISIEYTFDLDTLYALSDMEGKWMHGMTPELSGNWYSACIEMTLSGPGRGFLRPTMDTSKSFESWDRPLRHKLGLRRTRRNHFKLWRRLFHAIHAQEGLQDCVSSLERGPSKPKTFFYF